MLRLPAPHRAEYLSLGKAKGEFTMTNRALNEFVGRVRSAWGPLTSEVVSASRDALTDLLAAPDSEAWLSRLHETRPAGEELYRDPDHGFVLLAHVEQQGLYRPPHDHGRAWVVYGVQRGEVEMRTFGRVVERDGSVRLVQRDSTIMRPGQVQAYLPGDIHDTRCGSDWALLYRFTERDLKVEDRIERRLTRYAPPAGGWVSASL